MLRKKILYHFSKKNCLPFKVFIFESFSPGPAPRCITVTPDRYGHLTKPRASACFIEQQKQMEIKIRFEGNRP